MLCAGENKVNECNGLQGQMLQNCLGFVAQCDAQEAEVSPGNRSEYKLITIDNRAFSAGADRASCGNTGKAVSGLFQPRATSLPAPAVSYPGPAASFVGELPPLGPGPNELDVRLTHFESEYLKHRAFYFRGFTSDIQGEISRVHIYEDPSKFFKGVLDIYVGSSTSPKRFSGMGVDSSFLIAGLRKMKGDVKEGLAHNARYVSAQLQQIRGRIYHLFDVVDGKVPDKEGSFNPPLENMLGFRDRAHAMEVLANCVAIQVTYAPLSGLSNYVVDYQTASSGNHRSRVADIVIDVFNPNKTE